jgi:hypothetical protein
VWHTTFIVGTSRHVLPQLLHLATVRRGFTLAILVGTFGRMMKQKETLLFVTDSDFPFGIVWVAMLVTDHFISTRWIIISSTSV